MEFIHRKVQKKVLNSDQQEAVLYPDIDRLVSEKERLSAYERMKTMPQEKYKTCCCDRHTH